MYKKILAFVLIGASLLFIIQNMAVVEIQFLLWSFSLPRSVFLLLLLLVGFLVGWLWHGYLAHKKERQDQNLKDD